MAIVSATVPLIAGCRRASFLQALAEVDVEDFIATLKSNYPNEVNPNLRIDPSDPFVDRSQYRDLYPVQMNGKRYGHA
jgi:hypothetical protein